MCGGQFGLIHHTYIHRQGSWWQKLRFCSRKCRDGFFAKRDEEMDRKREAARSYPKRDATMADSSPDHHGRGCNGGRAAPR
jgi:hypothetical protein